MASLPAHPELGFYTLAGAPKSPRDMLGELADAEAMGLGTAFISERFNIKEAGALTGAAVAVTNSINIITAATNHTTRHPLVTASWQAPCISCRRAVSALALAAVSTPCSRHTACP